MKRIIMADDHAVVSTGLQLILNQTIDLRLVDKTKNGEDLLEKLHQNRYDLVLLDISMPGKDALDVLKEIKVTWPSLPVAIFTMNPDESFSSRMFLNGAEAYINKETHPDQIINILRALLRGEKYKTHRQQELLNEYTINHSGNPVKEHETLTDREYQVLHLLAQGVKKGDIANSLSVSKHTVSNHRNNILKKLNLSGNSDLTRYALQHGIIS
jgi:two-component system invasion response regulator UvrY